MSENSTKNTQNNQKEIENGTLENNNKKNSCKNKRTTTFVIGIVCAVIVLCEILANEILGFSFETNVIIQGFSIVLAALVWLGILKQESCDENKSISSIKDEISSQIENTIKSIKNKKEDK